MAIRDGDRCEHGNSGPGWGTHHFLTLLLHLVGKDL